MIQIRNLEQLKELCADKVVDGYIALNYGCRSSKQIEYQTDVNKWWVMNNIDDTEQVLTDEELYTESNIGGAIEKGAFYLYDI